MAERLPLQRRHLRDAETLFPNEPILEVHAPIAEAQFLETLVLNQVGFQTMIASKTARLVAATQGRDIVDFGGGAHTGSTPP